ncbi:MAG TPA: beta-ketoacyl-ACP synthase II [Frankiaceae bacterium]|nr:beta-ketoacyl-ACP synthase II [Frankiaceae bacterium]
MTDATGRRVTEANGRAAVVITGLGALTPLGVDVASTWKGLLAGANATALLDQEWAADLPVRIAAPLATRPDGSSPLDAIPRAQARRLDRVQQLALLAAREAWADAGTPEVEPERLAVVVASGIGGVQTLLAQYDVLKERGASRVSPHLVPMLMPNGAAAVVELEFGARAGTHTPVSACASGAEAIAYGLDLIRAGRADVVLAGGSEAAIHALPLAGFAAMRALSPRNDDPASASRPFDKARDGFVLGEGAGIVVLERASFAEARGARPVATLLGSGASSDAHHIAAPEPHGAGAARALSLALADAGVAPDDVAHINAHATSTPLGDVAEARAIRTAFGSAADSVVVSATKGSTGHLLGAAGAIEAIATVLALKEGTAPPTRNLTDPDDEVDLDVAAVDPRPLPAGAVGVSNAFGFGGHNLTLVFGA